MRVLLLGSGGREHAIGWKLAQSPQLTELISAIYVDDVWSGVPEVI